MHSQVLKLYLEKLKLLHFKKCYSAFSQGIISCWVRFEQNQYFIRASLPEPVTLHTCASCACEHPAAALVQIYNLSLHLWLPSMFAYILVFRNCLPESWEEESSRVIIFMQGNFTMAAFAESIMPFCTGAPFFMPVTRGLLHTWSWTGPATKLLRNHFSFCFLICF